MLCITIILTARKKFIFSRLTKKSRKEKRYIHVFHRAPVAFRLLLGRSEEIFPVRPNKVSGVCLWPRFAPKSAFCFSYFIIHKYCYNSITMKLFYTGKGDKGLSDVGRKKISKTHSVMDALGDLDELNSLVGLVRAKNRNGEARKILREVQEALFIIQANVSISEFGGKYSAPEFKNARIKEMEKTIDALEKKIKPERGFIISGESGDSAWLDFARTVARRAERSILKYDRGRKLNASIHAYLNRLSSLLFALARWASKKAGKKENHPSYK